MKTNTFKASKKGTKSIIKLTKDQLLKIIGGHRFEDDEVYQEQYDEIKSK